MVLSNLVSNHVQHNIMSYLVDCDSETEQTISAVISKVSNHVFEGARIAFFPDYPIRANSMFQNELNPTLYRQIYQIEVEENEPMQEVYVWSREHGSWQNRKAPIAEQRFPTYLPLRMLFKGQEGRLITLNIWGQKVHLLCSQKAAKFGDLEGSFESKLSIGEIKHYANKKISREIFYPGEFEGFVNITESKDADSQDLKAIYFNSYQATRHLDERSLQESFVKQACLGSGGEGVVYKVFDKTAGDLKALKITKTDCDQNRLAIGTISHALDFGHTCHLTRIFETFKVDTEAVKKGREFIPMNLKGSCSGYLMELMDGDFEKLWPILTKEQKAAMTIQLVCTDNLMHNRFKLQIADDKLRNIFYKKIDEEVTFQGKRVQDFDYLQYTIQGKKFYIPVKETPYLMKRGDYDQWTSHLIAGNSRFKEAGIGSLEVALDSIGYTLQQAEVLFGTPPSTTSILEMGTDR